MPLPGAPPKLFATTAITLPSAEVFTRYQFSMMPLPPTFTCSGTHVDPESVERKISPLCDTATTACPSLDESTQRHQWFAWPSGIAGVRQEEPPSLLTTIGPSCTTATTCVPSCDTVTASYA